MLSIPHMIVLFVVVLVVFGPQKLPELARGLGKLMAEFRKASLDFKTAFEEEIRDLERQALIAERKKAAEAATASAAPAAQPATLPAPASTETPTAEISAEPQAGDVPVISPVAQSVARGSEDAAEKNAEGAAENLPESSPDAPRPA
ncbi:MAG TPA: twin-arginine translocase TatA/TatE family subunit [Candidatus Acidoferrum sp.]|jgi:sec-independent protein translocase protein TatB|nr:twin-arginine translocase TatA/TatE family subunit [Candidatus Acidoferrum sp.]